MVDSACASSPFACRVDEIQAAPIVGDEIEVGFEVDDEQRLAVQFAAARGDLRAFARAARGFRHRDAGDDFAGREARQPFGLLFGAARLRDRARHHHGGCDERHRRDRADRAFAQRLRRRASSRPTPPCCFGDDEPGHAEFDQTFPEILRATFTAVGEATRTRQAGVIGEEFRQRVAQGFLFLRESEFHDQASLLIFGSFGMPRPRSLMMFF